MVNPDLPTPTLILAGILSQITFEKIALQLDLSPPLEYFEITWRLALFCDYPGIGWLELVLLSTLLTVLSVIRTPSKNKLLRGILTFVGSLILNASVGSVGFTGVYCLDEHFDYRISLEIFQYATTPIFASAAVFVAINYLRRPSVTTDQSTQPPEETHPLISRLSVFTPGTAIFLTGVCAQLTFEKLLGILVTSYPTAPDFCAHRGVGSWAQLSALSAFLLLIILCVNSGRYRLPRGVVTFLVSFLLNSSLGHIGGVGVFCGSHYSFSVRNMYCRYVTIPVVGSAALFFFAVFLKTSDDDYPAFFQFPPDVRGISRAIETNTRYLRGLLLRNN